MGAGIFLLLVSLGALGIAVWAVRRTQRQREAREARPSWRSRAGGRQHSASATRRPREPEEIRGLVALGELLTREVARAGTPAPRPAPDG